MAVGPQDYIDQMLAKKYSGEKVNNIEQDVNRLAMSSDRYWELQKDIAEVHRALVMVSTKIKTNSNLNRAAGCA